MKLLIFLISFAIFACGQNQSSAQNEPVQVHPDSIMIDGDKDHLIPRTYLAAQFVVSREIVDKKLITVWRIPRACNHDKKHDLFDGLIRHTYFLKDKIAWEREKEETGFVDDSMVKFVYQ